MKTLLISFALLFISVDQDQDDITGVWKMAENNAEVEIKKEGDVYNGTVVKSDVEKAIGKVVLRDFKKDGDEWKGKFYAVKRDRMVDATLKSAGENAMEMVVSVGRRTKTVPMARVE
ncbi:MAG: DUF2147 domain-containing protein [Bacteroidota bacterium]